MYYLRSIAILTTAALLTSSADARHPHRQGRPGYVTGSDGNHQAVPTSIEYTTHTIPKSHATHAVPTSIEYSTYNIPKPYATQPSNSSSLTSALPYSPTGTAPAVKARPTYLYGANAGGHLIVEKWMTPDLFEGTNATDQWSLDQTDGAEYKLKNHWETYYTKDDFAAMKKWGLNAVRIPIGFWAFDNDGTPYLRGADFYLERMIEWCRELGLWVLVDCHGSPGSQNGFDNSGRSGVARWQKEENLDRSIDVLKTMAAKYGSMKYADVVYGLQLVNEPISWNTSTLEVTQTWTKKAYKSVRAAAENANLVITMHDGFEGPANWTDVGNAINRNSSRMATAGFAVDTHLYQNQVESDKWLTQPEHIAKACDWVNTTLLPQNTTDSPLPVFVGEFSAATDICANPDGSTVAGTTCWTDGCQCANNVDMQWWNQPLKDVTRKFLEAELEAFEKGAQGWFIWSWKGPGAWGMENLIKYGVVGENVEDRKYRDQCGY
jgi:glucan 1,3-beta-glucosidase